MPTAQPNLFTRPDTLFGVCEGLGEDFGFNPTYLRLAMPVLLFFNPVATIAFYLAAGIVVLASRLIFPNPRTTADTVAASDIAVDKTGEAPESQPLPLAA